MSDPASSENRPDEPQGCVIVGVIPEQPERVVREAARYAALLRAPLVVVSVDVTRFVAAEDPDGYVRTAPIDVAITGAVEDLADVEAAVSTALAGVDVEWTVRQLVGDPAMAIKQLADRTNARLLVVGTRRRGFGESVREFFTGSVAARLAHRQHRPVLVVPTDEPARDDEELWPS
ncbi:universal stress protein [Microbacterium sp. X-17]|uniref:universal stress protein n=1 Tax=Microbacterium sp. X-17 TaxID=3144404 RepID=UPI0031F53789